MEREIVIDGGVGLANPLAGDRHYDGLQATDGTDISTRTKHREYMKRNGLTMSSDFTNEWAAAARKREEFRSGAHADPGLRRVIERELDRSTS